MKIDASASLVTVVYATDIRVTDELLDAIATTFPLPIILTCLLIKVATVSESVGRFLEVDCWTIDTNKGRFECCPV